MEKKLTDAKLLKLYGVRISQETSSFSYPWSAYRDNKLIASGFPSHRTLIEHLEGLLGDRK